MATATHTEQQTEALNRMMEWRDALHTALTDETVTPQDGGIWWAYIGLRKVMNDVAVAFGQDSFTETKN